MTIAVKYHVAQTATYDSNTIQFGIVKEKSEHQTKLYNFFSIYLNRDFLKEKKKKKERNNKNNKKKNIFNNKNKRDINR